VIVQVFEVVFIQYPLPASTVAVEPVIIVSLQLRPAALTATVPELLNILFCTIPLIILSYAA
jgi:hypothetical protein